jgi:hypothetical protein
MLTFARLRTALSRAGALSMALLIAALYIIFPILLQATLLLGNIII